MHPPERVAAALDLAATGLNASQISRQLNIPRETVKDWLAGKVPRGGTDGRSGPSCAACRMEVHEFDGLPSEYTYLLGMYLGDGCISAHRRDVYKLRIVLDLRYPEIIRECQEAMAAVRPMNRVGRLDKRAPGADHDTYTEIYSYSKSWPCFFPQHGPGVKHRRRIELAGWQLDHVNAHPKLLLRGLIHSDGCRFMNTGTNWRHPRYVFSNTSEDILQIFRDTCDRIGVHHTNSPRAIYVSRKADVATLDEFIGPKR